MSLLIFLLISSIMFLISLQVDLMKGHILLSPFLVRQSMELSVVLMSLSPLDQPFVVSNSVTVSVDSVILNPSLFPLKVRDSVVLSVSLSHHVSSSSQSSELLVVFLTMLVMERSPLLQPFVIQK